MNFNQSQQPSGGSPNLPYIDLTNDTDDEESMLAAEAQVLASMRDVTFTTPSYLTRQNALRAPTLTRSRSNAIDIQPLNMDFALPLRCADCGLLVDESTLHNCTYVEEVESVDERQNPLSTDQWYECRHCNRWHHPTFYNLDTCTYVEPTVRLHNNIINWILGPVDPIDEEDNDLAELTQQAAHMDHDPQSIEYLDQMMFDMDNDPAQEELARVYRNIFNN